MNPRIVGVILKKELLDTLRDKRTLIMMVGVPILLYPALMLIGMQFVLLQHSKLQATVSRVAIQSSAPETIERWLVAYSEKSAREVSEKEGESEEAPLNITVVKSDQPEVDLTEGRLDVLIVVTGDLQATLDTGETAPVEVRYDGTEIRSQDAAKRIDDALLEARDELQSDRLKEAGLAKSFARPLDIRRINMAPPHKKSGFILGLILPMAMIVMLALGAFYPAMDLTAGEKERGTFETLLSTPASKLEIVAGKFFTVFLLAMLTGVLNLASMGATLALVFSELSHFAQGVEVPQIHLPLASILIILGVIVPLAFFVSAMTMCIAVLARSFKEAQNYITPFFILITIPTAFAAMPGIELGPVNQFIPIANVVLLFRDLMTGKAGLEVVSTVFLSMAVFAMLALLLAAWLFQREDVVLSEEKGLPFTWRRSEFVSRPALTPASALGLFALVMVLIFYVGSLAQRASLIPGLLITEWGVILGPVLLVLWFFRANFKSTLNMGRVRLMPLLGALLIAPASVMLMVQFSSWQNKVLPLPEDIKQVFETLFASGGTLTGLLVLLLAAAISPAICEEALFRGAVLSGLRQRLKPWPAILLTGALFGIFHISIHRLVPTAILGVLLAYLVVRSGSIFISMIVHALINGLGIIIASGQLPVSLTARLETIETNGLPWGILLIALLMFLTGILIVEYTSKPKIPPIE
ncbi:MAG TPA: ABC transporter permease subunit/CPBP intramembrane protease [Candidatus Hydrogenedentes bacterium]|nr:ABC transporter permease subunit/CPBP intramembrane protease [Candidatus Hydrogenedentota bacterium]